MFKENDYWEEEFIEYNDKNDITEAIENLLKPIKTKPITKPLLYQLSSFFTLIFTLGTSLFSILGKNSIVAIAIIPKITNQEAMLLFELTSGFLIRDKKVELTTKPIVPADLILVYFELSP